MLQLYISGIHISIVCSVLYLPLPSPYLSSPFLKFFIPETGDFLLEQVCFCLWEAGGEVAVGSAGKLGILLTQGFTFEFV